MVFCVLGAFEDTALPGEHSRERTRKQHPNGASMDTARYGAEQLKTQHSAERLDQWSVRGQAFVDTALYGG